jgi:alpha-N-acetylglucosaminidase
MRLNRMLASLTLLAAMPNAEAAASASTAKTAARGVLQRLLPDHLSHFEFQNIPHEDNHDVFELESQGDTIVLRGSSGVAMCSALNWYLEHYCRCHVSWLGNQLDLPDPLPTVPAKVRKVSPHRYRYWLNYCAFSYSLAFWDWNQWERFIDWMALHGINMPLAVTGQEAIWQAVGKRFELSDEQMAAFLPGPAYLPFGWMGCLDGWGGPLPQSWIDQHVDLERKILARQRELGMTPVLQGFTGHLPAAMREKFPSARFHATRWAGFPETTFVDPFDPLFLEVGKAFIEEQKRLYGTDHFYAADTFIEMMPPSNDPAFLAGMGKAVYAAMAAADPEARWLMQGWIFINNGRFWQPPQAKALFGAVPDGRLILIEMGRDKYLETESYYGKPWIWTTIRNYGNKVELGSSLSDILQRANRAMASPQRGRLCGSGAIMEGLGYDPVVFELVADLNWRNDITDLESWVMEFIHHRYGRQSRQMEEAWKGLLKTVYDKPGGDGIIWMRPALKPRKHGRDPIPYDHRALFHAARQMLACADEFAKVDTFQYDLVHVVRQVMVNAARPIYEELVQAHQEKNREQLTAAGARLHALITDTDALLSTRREFLLGCWIADAQGWATNDEERRLYEWNARNQITLWGRPDTWLQGYARKHWAGLMADFYGGRWQLFVQRLDEALAAGEPFDADAFEKECQSWEDRWTRATNPYPNEPVGNPITTARDLLNKYADALTAQPQ